VWVHCLARWKNRNLWIFRDGHRQWISSRSKMYWLLLYPMARILYEQLLNGWKKERALSWHDLKRNFFGHGEFSVTHCFGVLSQDKMHNTNFRHPWWFFEGNFYWYETFLISFYIHWRVTLAVYLLVHMEQTDNKFSLKICRTIDFEILFYLLAVRRHIIRRCSINRAAMYVISICSCCGRATTSIIINHSTDHTKAHQTICNLFSLNTTYHMLFIIFQIDFFSDIPALKQHLVDTYCSICNWSTLYIFTKITVKCDKYG